jgi:CRISPR-associated protein Csb2
VMLVIEINLLTGRYVATRSNDRDRSEWPPHPARLFSALVAAWADSDDPRADERLALEWFETLGAPSICCTGEPPERALVTGYVPVNDATVLRDQGRLYNRLVEAEAAVVQLPADAPPKVRAKAEATLEKVLAGARSDTQRMTQAPETATVAVAAKALELLPELRVRQPRTYPTVLPADPRIWFVWSDVEALPGHTELLDGLLARVARLGHSSSMVSCRVADDPPEPAYVPDETGTRPIRVTAPGLLAALEVEYARHRGSEPRSLPAAITPYRLIAVSERRQGPDVPKPLLGDQWIVLRRSRGRKFSLRQSLQVARAVRRALISYAPEPVHETVSGHLPGAPGEKTPPTGSPHLAVVPLPNVGYGHSDGGLLGVGLILPRDVSAKGRRAVLQAVANWRSENDDELPLFLGDQGECWFEQVDSGPVASGLRPERWCRPATVWASVTPVALDRHPGDLRSPRPDRRARAEEEAREVIVQACRYAGLPEPLDIEIRLDTPWLGVPPARALPAFRTETTKGTRTDSLVRCCVHVHLRFGEAVSGPVLIGAGRYYGYGLFAPVPRGAGTARTADEGTRVAS